MKIDEFLESEAEELLIERCNAYIRRLAFQEVRQRWPGKIKMESKIDGAQQALVVYKVGSKEEEEKKEAERREKENMEIKEAVGLTALLRKIADSVNKNKFFFFVIIFLFRMLIEMFFFFSKSQLLVTICCWISVTWSVNFSVHFLKITRNLRV